MAETTTPQRRRTFTWSDPMIGAQIAPTMCGLDYLNAMERGELPFPPIMALMNISVQEAEEGRVVFSVEPTEYHYNPIGSVHGGLACTLCDSALGCAIHTMLPAGAQHHQCLLAGVLRPAPEGPAGSAARWAGRTIS